MLYMFTTLQKNIGILSDSFPLFCMNNKQDPRSDGGETQKEGKHRSSKVKTIIVFPLKLILLLYEEKKKELKNTQMV